MMLNVSTYLYSLIIPVALKSLTLIIQSKPTSIKEKLSPFECGFDSMSKSRMPFSLRFFLLSVLFLVFDVEIALILSLPLAMKSKPLWFYFPTATSFILILIGGLYHEWNEGTINWKSQKL